MNMFLSPYPSRLFPKALGLLRILLGILLLYHGWEIFDEEKMDEYMKWEVFNDGPGPSFWTYGGKLMELFSGIFLLFGFMTRLGAILLLLSMAYICFVIGEGRIFTQDQHPFLMILFGLLFLAAGPGEWSLDYIFLKRKNNEN